jgi:hypothetical protein
MLPSRQITYRSRRGGSRLRASGSADGWSVAACAAPELRRALTGLPGLSGVTHGHSSSDAAPSPLGAKRFPRPFVARRRPDGRSATIAITHPSSTPLPHLVQGRSPSGRRSGDLAPSRRTPGHCRFRLARLARLAAPIACEQWGRPGCRHRVPGNAVGPAHSTRISKAAALSDRIASTSQHGAIKAPLQCPATAEPYDRILGEGDRPLRRRSGLTGAIGRRRRDRWVRRRRQDGCDRPMPAHPGRLRRVTRQQHRAALPTIAASGMTFRACLFQSRIVFVAG